MRRVKYQPIHNFKCTEPGCGHVIPLARNKGEKREQGHIKHIWCIKCKKETKHEENHKDYSTLSLLPSPSPVLTY